MGIISKIYLWYGQLFFYFITRWYKNKRCEELNEEHSKRYRLKNCLIINPNFLKNTIHFINSYRNICAHNERFYNCTFQKKGFKVDDSSYTRVEFRGTVFGLLVILKLFLLKNEFETLKNDFKELLINLEDNLKNNRETLKKIKISSLRLPIDWENISNTIWE